MSRIICLDVGEKRTGVAITDETRTIARGLTTIEHNGRRELLEAVKRLLAENEVGLLVVGLPVSLGGKPTTRSESVRRFARRLEQATGIPVELCDEDLSTVRANEVLEQTYGRPQHRVGRPATGRAKRRRQAVDRIAATIILQDYLAEKDS